MNKNNKQFKMESMSINKLLLGNAIPLIFSMLIQALYNMVDSIFVSKISQDAFNAVSMSFPIQNVMIAIAAGTGTGLVALISRSFGNKEKEKASVFAHNGVFIALISYIIVLIYGIFFIESFFKKQTIIPGIIEGGTTYLTICTVLSFGLFGEIIFERFMQSTGKAVLAMVTQLVGAIVNIILDPLLIFGIAFFPKLGIAGAAVATVVGQICACILGYILNKKYNKELKIEIRKIKPNIQAIKDICKIGIPSMLTIGVGSIMTFLMNKLLLELESTGSATAVFGAFFKIQSFFIMPVLGLSQGMSPIVGYNLGARRKDRMIKTYRLSVIYGLIYMSLGTLSFFFIPKFLLELFSADALMLEIGIKAFKMIAITFIFAGYGIITSNFFMACGKSILSFLMSLARQLIVLLPVAYILGYNFGYQYIWYAIPIGELASMLMAIFGRIRMNKTILIDKSFLESEMIS